MKTIIAGGRDYHLDQWDELALNLLDITEVVSGCCRGVDTDGANWAKKKGIPIAYFPADWANNKKAAGPIRNRQMAEYADAVVLFPGSRGTENMYQEAMKRGLTIFDYRDGREPGMEG